VDLKANTRLSTDLAPALGGNLNLNNRNIIGAGDVRTSVWGIDIVALNAMVALLIESNNNIAIDFGSFNNPTGFDTNVNGYSLDLGTFDTPEIANRFNFGTFV
jgi:hypothetical protein